MEGDDEGYRQEASSLLVCLRPISIELQIFSLVLLLGTNSHFDADLDHSAINHPRIRRNQRKAVAGSSLKCHRHRAAHTYTAVDARQLPSKIIRMNDQ
jgi:hypothetical protein